MLYEHGNKNAASLTKELAWNVWKHFLQFEQTADTNI